MFLQVLEVYFFGSDLISVIQIIQNYSAQQLFWVFFYLIELSYSVYVTLF